MRILILGARSRLAHKFVETNRTMDLIQTTHKGPGKKYIKFFPETSEIRQINEYKKIDAAFIFFAYSDPDFCESNYVQSHRLNVDCTLRVIKQLIELGKKVIFCSTEMVYDGKKEFNKESDLLNPVNYYGIQKRIIENFLLRNYEKSSLIFRIAKTFDVHRLDNLVGKWVNEIQSGKKEFICVSDQHFSLISTKDFSEVSRSLIEIEATGVFNIGGPVRFSRNEILTKLFHLYKTVDPMVINIKSEEFYKSAKRPLDVSMDVSKMLSTISYNFEPIENQFKTYL